MNELSASRVALLLALWAACVSASVPQVFAANSDARTVRFWHISRNEGLSQAFVYAIAQDPDGFMWFGTQEGLNRYDGTAIRVFRTDSNDPESLADDTIRSILIDASGSLWIGTDGGLSLFDRVRETFTNFRHDPDDPDSMASDRVRVVFEDAAGNLWIGTDGAGLDKFDRATGKFAHYFNDQDEPDSLSNDKIWGIVEGAPGEIWIGTEYGLNRFDPGAEVFRTYTSNPDLPGSLSDNHAQRLFVDAGGTLWVGTEGGGLNRFDRTSDTFTHFRHDPADPFSLSSDRISSIHQDESGVVWVGTEKGLNALNSASGDFDRYDMDPANEYSLPDNNVKSIFEDKGGVLWVGTYDGVSAWNTRIGAMLHYYHKANDPASLSANNVNAFAADREGRIWVGTFGGGVNIFDRETETFSHLLANPADRNSLSSDEIGAIAVDREGTVWLGTRHSGLNSYDPASGVYKRYLNDKDDPTSIGGNVVTSIVEDSKDRLWVATYAGGLNRFKSKSDSFTRVAIDNSGPETKSDIRLLTILEDSLGYLWLGTDGTGLIRIEPGSGQFLSVRADNARTDSLSGDKIYALTEDRDGNLWIGTKGDGVSIWSLSDRKRGLQRFKRLTPADGLPSSTTYSILQDPEGGIWLSSQDGLTHFDPESGELRVLDVSDGLQSKEFNISAGFAASDGQLFFGGINGFNAFYADLLQTNDHEPQIAITSVSKLNEPVDLTTVRQSGDRLQLGHKDYFVSFGFAALDYAAPAENRYHYKLDGLDADWVDAGTKAQASYTNLAPGDYTFKVRAANNDGIWNNDGASLGLSVSPAPWETWWAYGLYLFVFGLLGLTVFRIQSVRLRQAAVAKHADELEIVNSSLEREIAARQGKEAALQHEKEKAQTYFDVAEVILFTVDANGHIGLINNQGGRVFGVGAGSVVGKHWLDFVPKDWRQVARVGLNVGIKRRENPESGYTEFPIVAANGDEHLIAWNFTALPSNGESGVALCSGMDITKLRVLEKQVRLREKMNAVGTLAGGIAHDFNNILQSIYGFTSLTLDKLSAKDEKAEFLREVIQGTDRARDLVRRILTFSSQEEYELKPMDIGPVVEEASAFLRGSFPPSTEIVTDVEQDQGWVMADPTRIHQLVMNLGANAGQAISGDGGVINVRLRVASLSAESLASGTELRPGDYVVVSVADTGSGMDADVLEHMFDPFFTTKDVGSGTGLGLPVVHGIVESHKGEVTVDSRPGAGTTVTVYLPLCERVEIDETATEPDGFGGREHLLVVDDEESVAIVTKKMLEARGYSVSICFSGAEALDCIGDEMPPVALVITDEAMPKMTGTELQSALRDLEPNLPIVIMSGIQASRALASPPTYFLQKPCTTEELLRAVRLALDDRPDAISAVAAQA